MRYMTFVLIIIIKMLKYRTAYNVIHVSDFDDNYLSHKTRLHAEGPRIQEEEGRENANIVEKRDNVKI